MNLGKKKTLLVTAETIANGIIKEEAESAVPKILNAIQIVAKTNPNSTDENELLQLLNKFKKLPFGGNKEKNGFEKILINIEKNHIFRTRNGNLTMSEIEYVFAWVRRLVKVR